MRKVRPSATRAGSFTPLYGKLRCSSRRKLHWQLVPQVRNVVRSESDNLRSTTENGRGSTSEPIRSATRYGNLSEIGSSSANRLPEVGSCPVVETEPVHPNADSMSVASDDKMSSCFSASNSSLPSSNVVY